VIPLLADHDHPALSTWGWVEWTIFAVCCLVTAWVLWLAVRWTLHPGEEEPDHVKRSILDDDPPPSAPTPATHR
jgi:hypothetical protein